MKLTASEILNASIPVVDDLKFKVSLLSKC